MTDSPQSPTDSLHSPTDVPHSPPSASGAPLPTLSEPPSPDAGVVLAEHPDPAILLLRIHRPEARNALNLAVRRRLADLVEAASTDPELRCVVVTGDDRAFAAGADLRELAGRSPIDMLLHTESQRAFRALVACPKPVIAAVNGFAWGGGCELAMHCDLIVAGEGASFCQPEIRVGIIPGAGGTQRLPRAVGKFKAMKMLLTAQPVNGIEAERMGLASEVVADDQVLPRALELARIIAAMPPLAAAQIKEVVLAGMDASLDTGLRLERRAFQLLMASDDRAEGMQAFFDKRKPIFKGR
jgi:enoyl-CoA hydratase/carnithine racemase